MQSSQEPLTDSKWEYIKKIVDNGRKRKTDLRMVFDAILWITRTGTQWRNIDSMYKPHLPIIQYYYYSWQKKGILTKALDSLVRTVRELKGDEPSPSRVAFDSQSVKSVPFVNQDKGIDGNKRINGRKRHIAVDKYGLPLAIHVSAANCHDSPEGLELLWQLEKYERIELCCVDNAYHGTFEDGVVFYGWQIEFGQKPESKQGFIPQKGRWQVERSFAWCNFYRRLSKGFEKTVNSTISFIQLAFINMILAKIHRLKT